MKFKIKQKILNEATEFQIYIHVNVPEKRSQTISVDRIETEREWVAQNEIKYEHTHTNEKSLIQKKHTKEDEKKSIDIKDVYLTTWVGITLMQTFVCAQQLLCHTDARALLFVIESVC